MELKGVELHTFLFSVLQLLYKYVCFRKPNIFSHKFCKNQSDFLIVINTIIGITGDKVVICNVKFSFLRLISRTGSKELC